MKYHNHHFDYKTEHFRKVSVCGIMCEFSDVRIDCGTVPEGKYHYEMSTDVPARVCRGFMTNFFATLISDHPLPIGSDGVLLLKEEDLMSIDDHTYVPRFSEEIENNITVPVEKHDVKSDERSTDMNKNQECNATSIYNKDVTEFMMEHILTHDKSEYLQALLSSKYIMYHSSFSMTDMFRFGEIWGFVSTSQGADLLERIKDCIYQDYQDEDRRPIEIGISDFPRIDYLSSFVEICEIFGISVSIRTSDILNKTVIRLTNVMRSDNNEGE